MNKPSIPLNEEESYNQLITSISRFMCEQENTLLIANNFQLSMGTGYDVLSMLLKYCKADHDF